MSPFSRFSVWNFTSKLPTTGKKLLNQQFEILQNVIASYTGLRETVSLRVREQDPEEAKMFIKNSLKKGLREKVACVLGLGELPVSLLITQKPQGSI